MRGKYGIRVDGTVNVRTANFSMYGSSYSTTVWESSETLIVTFPCVLVCDNTTNQIVTYIPIHFINGANDTYFWAQEVQLYEMKVKEKTT